MSYGSDLAVSNLEAGAANLVSDIMRGVVDRDARAAALALLGQAMVFALAGTVAKDMSPPKRFTP